MFINRPAYCLDAPRTASSNVPPLTVTRSSVEPGSVATLAIICSISFLILGLSFIIIFFIDLKHYIIPNVLTFSLMIIGFLKSFDPNLNPIFPNHINSLIGGIFGYLIIWSIIYFYKQVRKKEGMGLGDAKLLSAIGFWFGWISIPFVLFLSSIIALLSVIPSLLKNSKSMSSKIPFGPYIIIGTLVYLFFENSFKSLLF